MTATATAPRTISERIEAAASAVSLPSSGFQKIENGTGLVMGTPTAVVVTAYIVTIATSTQWTSAFVGGAADRDVSFGRTPMSDAPSLDELIRLYES